MPPVFAAAAAFISGALAGAGIAGPLILTTAGLTGAYGAGATLGIALAGIVGAVGGIGTLISVGAAALSLLAQPEIPAPATPSSQTQIVRTAAGYRRKGWGLLRGGGHLLFEAVKKNTALFTGGGGGGNSLMMIVAFADGPVSSFEGFYLDGRPVEVDENLAATSEPFAGRVKFDTRLGLSDQAAFATLLTEFPAVVDSSWRGLGVAMIQATLRIEPNYYTVFPNGWRTEVSALAHMSPVYDPREASHDPDDWTDKASWSASRNAALIILDELAAPRTENGFNIPREFLDDDSFSAAADRCDLSVDGPLGSTRAQWTLDGWGGYGEPPSTILTRMLTSCDGELYITQAGRIGLRVGGWEAPTVTLTDDDIYRIKRTDGGFIGDIKTVIRSKYLSRAHGNIEMDAKEYEHAAAAEIGREPVTLDFIMAADHGQCRHLQKINSNLLCPDMYLTVETMFRGLKVEGERYIRIASETEGIDGAFRILGEVKELVDSDGFVMGVTFACVSCSQATEDYDELTEGVAPPEVSIEIDNDLQPDAPTIAVVQNGAEITVTVTPESDQYLTRIRLLPTYDQTELPAIYHYLEAGVTETTIALDDGTDYEVDANSFTVSGQESSYSAAADISVRLDGTAPADPTGVSASASGAGQIQADYTTSASGNIDRAKIYVSTVNDSATAVLAGAFDASPSTAYQSIVGGLAAGDTYVWVALANGSNTESTRVAASGTPVTVT
jgi:hypothetical protein